MENLQNDTAVYNYNMNIFHFICQLTEILISYVSQALENILYALDKLCTISVCQQ